MIIVECDGLECDTKFERYASEVKRSKRLGRKQFCGNKCLGEFSKKNLPKKNWDSSGEHISKFCGNRKDEYSNFRWYIKVMNNKTRSQKSNSVDLKYLKKIWDKQGGICPISGMELIPRTHSNCKEKIQINHASIDRIDNSKGYEVNNIRFVSVMANYARNTFSDEDLVRFCSQVSEYQRKED